MVVQQRGLAWKWFGTFALGSMLVGAAAHAQQLQLPTPKAVEQAGLLKEADAQYQRYIAAPDSFFAVDAANPGWPCKVSASVLQELTGTSNYASGNGAAGYGHSFSEVAIHPVEATCKKGRLDGKVELVYEAVRKGWGPHYQTVSNETGRVVATIAAGKLAHRLELRKSVEQGQGATTSTAVTSSAEHPQGSFITSATILVTGEGQKFFLKQPVQSAHGKRQEKAFYAGTTLVSVEQSDAKGKPDGLAVNYAGGEEKKSCFKGGQVVGLAFCGK